MDKTGTLWTECLVHFQANCLVHFRANCLVHFPRNRHVSAPNSDWWGSSHTIKRHKIQTQIAKNDKRNAEELLLIQMFQLRNDVEESIQQVHLADKAFAASLENVRLNADCYQAGTCLLSDLLDAQNTLQQTRDQRTETITVYYMK